MKKWQIHVPGLPYYPSDNVHHHPGLRFVAPETVRQHLSTRDFLYFGASAGDSFVILTAYATDRMISYELIPKACHRALRRATSQCLICNIGIAGEVGVVYVPQYDSPGSNIRMHNSEAINWTTVGKEGERLNLTFGLIKADIEGTELPMLIGGLRMIQRDRPVVSLTIYHGEQLLDVSLWTSELKGYKVNISSHVQDAALF
jgi:hypothetical protein